MSNRHVRKVFGGNELPPPDSDGEFEPLGASAASFSVAGFMDDSPSEEEKQKSESEEEEAEKKKKKKKKKGKKNKNVDGTELDEIDKCVMEVNKLLGAPAPAPVVAAEAVDPAFELLAVQLRHLNYANDLSRLLGPDPEDKKRIRDPNKLRLAKKSLIVHLHKIPLNFTRLGLSMAILRREEDATYFVFEHTRHYQRIHREYLLTLEQRTQNLMISAEEAENNMHVESMIENADILFYLEEFQTACALLERALGCMEYVLHPAFNYTNRKTRLEYRYLENRPFMIALLKHAYVLSNKACHRTAMEMMKLLLNLDPSDPLAAIFVIDTFAIRAYEHQWLIDSVRMWGSKRDAQMLFNMQYSNALAHFHVAMKNKADTAEADRLLREAMMRFPYVFSCLMELASTSSHARHEIFTTFSAETTSKTLSELCNLYAALTTSRWREQKVNAWLIRVAKKLAEDYDNDAQVKERMQELGKERRLVFQVLPVQFRRHLAIIKPMSTLLVDGAVPRVSSTLRPTDPFPPADTIDRYAYLAQQEAEHAIAAADNQFINFIASIYPDFNINPDNNAGRPSTQPDESQENLQVNQVEARANIPLEPLWPDNGEGPNAEAADRDQHQLPNQLPYLPNQHHKQVDTADLNPPDTTFVWVWADDMQDYSDQDDGNHQESNNGDNMDNSGSDNRDNQVSSDGNNQDSNSGDNPDCNDNQDSGDHLDSNDNEDSGDHPDSNDNQDSGDDKESNNEDDEESDDEESEDEESEDSQNEDSKETIQNENPEPIPGAEPNQIQGQEPIQQPNPQPLYYAVPVPQAADAPYYMPYQLPYELYDISILQPDYQPGQAGQQPNEPAGPEVNSVPNEPHNNEHHGDAGPSHADDDPRPRNNDARDGGNGPHWADNDPRRRHYGPRRRRNGTRRRHNGPRDVDDVPPLVLFWSGPNHGENGRLPDENGPRPGANGPRADDNGPRPGANGPRLGDNGPRPGANGPNGPRVVDDVPPLVLFWSEPTRRENGRRPDENGPRPGANGPRPGDNGPRPGANGPRPGDNGPRPGANGPRPCDNGPRPGANGPRPDDNGPRPGANSPRPGANGTNRPRRDPNEPCLMVIEEGNLIRVIEVPRDTTEEEASEILLATYADLLERYAPVLSDSDDSD